MLENVDSYDEWQKEHIVPKDNNDISNLAIACRTCNFIKRRTDPRVRATKHDRASLVEAAREIVQERRQAKEAILLRTREAAETLVNPKHERAAE